MARLVPAFGSIGAVGAVLCRRRRHRAAARAGVPHRARAAAPARPGCPCWPPACSRPPGSPASPSARGRAARARVAVRQPRVGADRRLRLGGAARAPRARRPGRRRAGLRRRRRAALCVRTSSCETTATDGAATLSKKTGLVACADTADQARPPVRWLIGTSTVPARKCRGIAAPPASRPVSAGTTVVAAPEQRSGSVAGGVAARLRAAMAHQYIYTMQNLRRVHPPNKEVLKGIYLSFYPGAKIGVLGSNGSGQVDAAAHHGGRRQGLLRRGQAGRRHPHRLPAAGAAARPDQERARNVEEAVATTKRAAAPASTR